MNVVDFIRHSNSWHWLAAVVALSAIGSAFMPTYGWKSACTYRRASLEPRIRQAQATLDGLKALDATEALAADKATADIKARTKKLKRDFAAYGLDPIPVGDEAVFAAQSRISEALSKHHVRIVSNDASVAMAAGATASSDAVNAPPSDSSKAVAQPQMSAAEYRRQVEAQASKMSDRAMREMFMADARRQIARLEQAEKNAAAKAAKTATLPKSPERRLSRPSVAPQFRTSEIGYKVTGDFRDVFLFLVGETHRKSNEAFRDIVVRRGEDGGMDVSFTLRVMHK